MGLLALLFGSCSKPQRTPTPSAAKPLPEITADMEKDGFVDLAFALRSCERLPDGSQALHASGVHRGREVSFIVVLGSKWKKGAPIGSQPIYQGRVAFGSVGTASDNWLRALDELYGTKLRPRAMRLETWFTAISLQGNQPSWRRGRPGSSSSSSRPTRLKSVTPSFTPMLTSPRERSKSTRRATSIGRRHLRPPN